MYDPNQAAPQAATNAPAGAGQAQDQDVVCIADNEDGTYTVYPEGQGEDAGQQAKDLNGALQLVKQMLMGDEPDADDQGAGQDDAEALFQGGFKSARGTPLGG